MSLHRFYTLLLTTFFVANSYAQPYYQKGTQLLQVSAAASAEGRGADISNMSFALSAGTALFFTPKSGLGGEIVYRWAPFSQTVQTTVRTHFLLHGRSDLKHSLIADVHGILRTHMNRTLSGEMFGSHVSGAGLGLQYAYWPNTHTSIYIWPQLSRTNGGPSGLTRWELYMPVGLQWSWHHKR